MFIVVNELKVLGEYVLLDPIKDDPNKAGILLPPNPGNVRRGKVAGIGGHCTLDIKIGDIVIFSPRNVSVLNEYNYVIVHSSDILAREMAEEPVTASVTSATTHTDGSPWFLVPDVVPHWSKISTGPVCR